MNQYQSKLSEQNSNQVQALKSSVCIKGQIFPSKKGANTSKRQNLYIISENQRIYKVVSNSTVNMDLWRHLWESVIIQGIINYQKKTLEVNTFYPAHSEKLNYVSQNTTFDEKGYEFEIRHYNNLVCNGFNIVTSF